MARPLRIEFPGAIYHVTSRGDRREPIFEDDTDRFSFLNIIGTAMERCDACLLAYCLMGNHYHLVVHTRLANLSRLMRQINGIYTQTYNKRHDKVGHLFQGRFKAILVDSDAYLLEVCRYVDLNPVRACMVTHPGNWKWSSYAAHTGYATAPAWLDVPAVQGYLLGRPAASSHDRASASARYAMLVAQGKDVRLWDDALRQQIYLGEEAFVARMQTLLGPEKLTSRDVPRIQRRNGSVSVRGYFQKNSARDNAIVLAHREGQHTMSAIAKEAGLSVSRVSRVIAAAEAKAKGKT